MDHSVVEVHVVPDDDSIGPITVGKLLARKRSHLLPVYGSRVMGVLKRPRTDNSWWHDLRCQLMNDPDLIRQLQSVRARAGANHMSPAPRLRRDVLDVQLGRRSLNPPRDWPQWNTCLADLVTPSRSTAGASPRGRTPPDWEAMTPEVTFCPTRSRVAERRLRG